MTSSTAPKTIILKGEYVGYEAIMADSAALQPGMLAEIASTGKIQKQSSADVFVENLFVLENELIGEGIDDLYANGETVPYAICQSGTEVYALLAANIALSIGAVLQSNGSGGTLKAVASGKGIAVALEAISSVAAVQRVKVRII